MCPKEPAGGTPLGDSTSQAGSAPNRELTDVPEAPADNIVC
jgi:hypothetical protein